MTTQTDSRPLPAPAEAETVRAPELGVALGSASSSTADMTDDPEYQAWVESMAKHCRCSHDCPCDGVLAGGICDDRQEGEEYERETCTTCHGSGQYDDCTPCPDCDGDGTCPW